MSSPQTPVPPDKLDVRAGAAGDVPGAEGAIYRAFFDKSPDGMLILSDLETVADANSAACVLLGVSRRELLGNPLSDFMGDDGASGESAGFDLLDSAQTSGFRRLLRAGGRLRILEFSAASNFVPGQHLMILRDVTEQRIGERLRRDAERELKVVLDNVDAIISRYDRDLRFVYTNLQMKRVTGIPPYSVIGKRLDELPFPQEDVPEWNANLRHVFETGESISRDTFTASNPVGFQYFESSLTPEFDANGKVLSVLTISRNVSQRKLAEETRRRTAEELSRVAADLTDSRDQLRHQTTLFHLVVEQLAEGMVLCDPEGQLVYLNRAAHQVLPGADAPMTMAEWTQRFGLYLSDQTTPFPNEQLPLVRALQGESVDNVEMFVRPPETGQKFWLQVSARAVTDENGKLRCGVAVFRDITEAREAELRLEQVASDVRRKAAQLERSNTDLEQFAYVASHDLKEPLRMVTSYVQLLERRYRNSLDDDARQFIDFAVDGARRMYTLLDELLRYYRAGKHDRSLVAVESADLFRQVTHELALHCQETKGEITHGQLPVILGDPPQLRQLFYNLIENSIKYRGQEPPRIHVDSERQGDEWMFRVSDNGIGIGNSAPPERMFGIFQRLHRRDNLSGTGIGLAICRRIVTRHGGRIWFESQPGQGTTFFFTLPVVN